MGKAFLTISRCSGSDGEDYRIRIQDKPSGVNVVEVVLSGEDFARAITSMMVTADADYGDGLQFIGMRKVIEKRSVVYPGDFARSSREDMEEWLRVYRYEPVEDD